MSIRSLTLATLLFVAAPVFAANSDAPLEQERGKARPLVIIAPDKNDSTLVSLKKALDEPANRQAFSERNMVLYTVVSTFGERNGKPMDAQATMSLIRGLQLGVGGRTRVILIGKDGEKKFDEPTARVQDLFALIDQMPMREKEASAPAATPSTDAAPPAEKAPKSGKGKATTLDD